MTGSTEEQKQPASHCTFCQKGDTEVEVMIAGRGANICNTCIDDARDAVGHQRALRALQKRLAAKAAAKTPAAEKKKSTKKKPAKKKAKVKR